MFLLVFCLIPLLIFGGYVWQSLEWESHFSRTLRRSQQTDRLATVMGLEFDQRSDFTKELVDCQIFQLGDHSQRFDNCLSGESDGIEFSLFELSWQHGFGKHTRDYAQTVCLIRSQSMQMPEGRFRPKVGSDGDPNRPCYKTAADVLIDQNYFTS